MSKVQRRNITVNVLNSDYVEIICLCSESGCSLNEYGRALIRYAIAHKLHARVDPDKAEQWKAAAIAGNELPPRVPFEIEEVAA